MHKLTVILVALGIMATGSMALAGDKPCKERQWVPVSGTGTHYFTTAIIHSQEPTETGFIQRSTDIVELDGDLKGRVLYHPKSVFDFAAGTLVNTGHQVFSGTVLGSSPVMIYDDQFRFEVGLNGGNTVGKIYLTEPLAGPRIKCILEVMGPAPMPGENATIAYTGRCKMKVAR